MKINLTFRLSFFILAFTYLSACWGVTPVPVATMTPTVKLPTATPTLLLPTQTSTPLVNQQIMDSWLTQISIATPIRTPVSQTNINKLNKSGMISDDGQVIVFYRNEAIYAINSDGSNERLIVDSKSLPTLGQGEIMALTFKPNSHFLLFNTYLCNPRPNGPSYNAPDCTVGIYGVDADSGDLAQIVAGLSGNTMQDRNFEISPDGQYISVASSGHINIYRGSDIYYQNAIVYNITRPDEYLPRQFWLPDSSGLLAIVATDEYNEPGTPPWGYAVYRYKLGETAVQIPLNIPIVRTQGETSCVSPDRNWILFAGTGGGQLSNIWSYLGNLNNGQTLAFEENGWLLYDCQWSPDSRHFVSTRNAITFIGSIDGSLPIPVGGHFLEWIDNNHYYYMVTINSDSHRQKSTLEKSLITNPSIIKKHCPNMGGSLLVR